MLGDIVVGTAVDQQIAGTQARDIAKRCRHGVIGSNLIERLHGTGGIALVSDNRRGAKTRQHRIGAVAGLFQIVERSQRFVVFAFRGEVQCGEELVTGSGSLAVDPVLIADPASCSQNNGHSAADQQRTEIPPDLLCPFRTDFLVYLANETVVCHGPATKAKLMFVFVRSGAFSRISRHM